MSAGQTARRSLRTRRVRIALGATAAAAALALGGSVTAHADNSAPAPEKSVKQVEPTDPCEELPPVDAVPGEDDTPWTGPVEDLYYSEDDPVDALPGDDCELPPPDWYKDITMPGEKATTSHRGAEKAKPARSDKNAKPAPGARDAKPAPAKR